ncbi:DUF4279 domain-containing protein [Nostoc sp.]
MFVLSEDQKWYRARLRLLGDSLPVDSVQEKLQLVPSVIGKKGEHINGDPQHPKYETNLWVSSYLTNSDVPFEKQIGLLLDVLESNIESLREILSLPNVEGNLSLGFSSGNGLGGDYFSHHLLQRIVNCGLSVTLDLYPPSIDEEDDEEDDEEEVTG